MANAYSLGIQCLGYDLINLCRKNISGGSSNRFSRIKDPIIIGSSVVT